VRDYFGTSIHSNSFVTNQEERLFGRNIRKGRWGQEGSVVQCFLFEGKTLKKTIKTKIK